LSRVRADILPILRLGDPDDGKLFLKSVTNGNKILAILLLTISNPSLTVNKLLQFATKLVLFVSDRS